MTGSFSIIDGGSGFTVRTTSQSLFKFSRYAFESGSGPSGSAGIQDTSKAAAVANSVTHRSRGIFGEKARLCDGVEGECCSAASAIECYGPSKLGVSAQRSLRVCSDLITGARLIQWLIQRVCAHTALQSS